ncbi:helix-turn-helix domain-containing protein [Streptomyces scopuliridis]|uniref:Helix-turn-helix domain-containing protein n=1 Tax=Streptomyces scopuliridis TaxID=452529 RepID=A0ACD4ZYZ3_9ACTN|nr:helix-turn-helix domain-containing protein [Streptomyces scopuliridis]WSB37832.1 helix-turn-helix domain-containing protein [Streptomyces scopuliridis]WSC02287.1 helix-turn-helix domain-containing protein [Streptomyces scopuliridis]WSC04176.1 helix-turn-helix domain-containing protein [Streptomyces scopuliridis]
MSTAAGSTGAPEPPGSRSSRLHRLMALSGALSDGRDEREVLRLAASCVARLGPWRTEAGYLPADGRLVRCPLDSRASAAMRRALDSQVDGLGGQDGAVLLADREWSWAFALQGPDGRAGSTATGYLVVSAGRRPGDDDIALLGLLARQTGAAVTGTAARRREREYAAELSRARQDGIAARARLAAVESELTYRRSVHDALSGATATGDTEAGIAWTVHRLTGFSAVVEDQFGNLRAWAGPGCPDPYPKPDPGRQEQLILDAIRDPRPVYVGHRLTAVARHRGEILGTVSLVDPEGAAGEREEFALDHACDALALEMAHLRSLAEMELRLRRELVDDLITGTDDESAFARAAAVGHDLHGAQHLVAVGWMGLTADDGLVQAVAGAAAGLGLRSLVARRSGRAVLVVQGRPKGEELYLAVSQELGSRAGAIGIGSRCDSPAEIPRSYQEALRALEVRQRSRVPHGATSFDDLGLYRIIGTGDDYREIEGYVREWLGPLLDYDAAHRGELVRTLSQYFEAGGNYDGAASALGIHRSTLRYRLQRLREIGGHDLGDVETRLNLHVATRVWKVLGGEA